MEKEIMKVVNKKIRKGIVLMIVLGIVFGGIAGVTAYTISAKEIGYSPKDSSWKVNNVADAIESLKTLKGGSQNYSLDEQVVGTWIDGKPLYQKTLTGKVSGNDYSLINLADLNIEKCLEISGSYYATGFGYMPFNYSKPDYITGYYKESTKTFEFRADSNYNDGNYYFTIKYTKTTDNATNS